MATRTPSTDPIRRRQAQAEIPDRRGRESGRPAETAHGVALDGDLGHAQDLGDVGSLEAAEEAQLNRSGRSGRSS